MNGHGEDTLPVTLLAPDAGQAGPPPHGTRRSWPDAVHQAPGGAGNQGKGGFNHHFFDFPGVLQPAGGTEQTAGETVAEAEQTETHLGNH